MPVQIPFIPEEFNYSVSTVLDDTEFTFDVYWNGRDEAWYFDLSDADGIIRSGIKIMLGSFLGRRSVDPRYPNGTLVASDLSNEGVDATFQDIGVRVVVFFYSADEILS